MVNVDRSIKVMLGLIVVLLGVLVLRPMLSVETEAQASSTNADGNAVIEAYKTRMVTNIPLLNAEVDPLLQIVVLDDAHSFILQRKHRLEVYHLDDLTLRDDIKIQR